jgi:hypothetical protein
MSLQTLISIPLPAFLMAVFTLLSMQLNERRCVWLVLTVTILASALAGSLAVDMTNNHKQWMFMLLGGSYLLALLLMLRRMVSPEANPRARARERASPRASAHDSPSSLRSQAGCATNP